MIAVDTNVLLRYLLADDVNQHSKASKLIKTSHSVLITDVVLVETVWTLSGRRYSLGKEAICKVVRQLIGDGAFRFESSQVVWSALMDYQDSQTVRGKLLDFSDALINRKALYIADGAGKGLEGFYSFDKAVEQLPGALKP